MQGGLKRMDTAVGILQSDSHPTPRDSEGCGGAERPLQSYLDAQREVVAIAGTGSNFSRHPVPRACSWVPFRGDQDQPIFPKDLAGIQG